MILCVGTTPAVQRTLVFDKLTLDEVNRATTVRESAAGKSINVARVLVTLGKHALATGFLGGGSGQFLQSELQRQSVASDFVNIPSRTRTCTTVVDRSADTITELVEESSPIAADYWAQLEQVIASHLPRCRAMVLSGGLPPGAPQAFYGRCCELARPLQIPVVLDARGEPLRLAMPYQPLMVKPNRAELGSTFGFDVQTDQQLKDAIHRLLEMGTQTALITMGARGAVFCDGKSFWMLHAPTVEVANPIGSGDSVAAGYVMGIVDGLSPLDSAILGIACGSANAMTPIPGEVQSEDVSRLRSMVQVETF